MYIEDILFNSQNLKSDVYFIYYNVLICDIIKLLVLLICKTSWSDCTRNYFRLVSYVA